MTFTIGADPELFVGKNGKFVSAHGMVPGNKQNPFPVEGGAVQVDGMALEYNINPSETKKDFVHKILNVRSQMEGMLEGVQVLPTCTVEFDEVDIQDVPDANKILGCSVDFNAYTLMDNPKPDGDMMMRTAGGHVHIGSFFSKLSPFEPSHRKKCERLTRLMDRELGIYSLIWDKDVKRRSMYGQAGCFRPTTFGVEYRSLSNVWIFNKQLIQFVYDATERAYQMFLSGEDVVTEEYREVIDNSVFDSPLLDTEQGDKLRGIMNA